MSRKHLSARDRETLLKEAESLCHLCGLSIKPGQAWQVSHPNPLAAGGEDIPENRAPAHTKCHAKQTAEIDAPLIAKVRRIHQKHLGIRSTAKRPLPGTKASGWKRKLDGTTERRT